MSAQFDDESDEQSDLFENPAQIEAEYVPPSRDA